MSRKKEAPWGPLGDGKPIERVVSKQLCAADPRFADFAEKEVRAEQYRRMVRVKEHYGIEGETGWRPWYEFALALASERDSALTIIDQRPPRTDRTAPRARSAEGLQLVKQIVDEGGT